MPTTSRFSSAPRALLPILISLAIPCHAAAPNFVLLLVDDAALMDFGGYGGEAHTPNINQLADRGIRFSNYHTSPLCSTSRAMLLTGMDNHRTGVGTIPEVLHTNQATSPAYSLHLLPGVKTIAARLQGAGYKTFMTGKWHLGSGEAHLPNAQGFDRSYALDASGADNWEHKSFMPLYDDAPWFEDGEPARLPENFYSSEFIVDKMIEYLEARDPSVPFLSYLAFLAIHIPVQAPREFTDRYEGVYAGGWDALRQSRSKTARELGLMPENALPPQPHPSLRAWAELSAEEQLHYERNMMVNAGMLEAMDYHIGRLIEYLESKGELANTVFIVTSDNGPEFNDPSANGLFRFWMSQNDYHADPARAGEAGYMGGIGPEWASAAAVPGSLFKMYASEGSTRVPLIIAGPDTQPRNGFLPAFSFVTDIAPTIAAMAQLPDNEESDGRSLLPLLKGEVQDIYLDDDPVGMEVAGNAALFKGRYKLTRNTLPHGDARWRLHDIRNDPAELEDLSEADPERYDEMMADYEQYAAYAGVVSLPVDFNIQRQIAVNTASRWIAQNRLIASVISLSLLALIAAILALILRRSDSV